MKIFVCIKQVPGIAEVKIDPKTGILIREGVPSVINPVDKNAIEIALILKKKTDSQTSVLSMGPPQAEEALREALAMGIDTAYLLTDKKFAGADTLATSYTLSMAIKKLLGDSEPQEDYLVICGSQAIDGDTAQVGPELAEELQIPQITNVQKIDFINSKIVAESILRPEEIMVLETKLPALVTVVKELNSPRIPTLPAIVEAYDTKVVLHWTSHHLNVDENRIGISGSQTQVAKIFTPQQKGEYIKLSGSIQEMVTDLTQSLKEDKIL
jgi:electron transfer flavoprotein beta subunit